MKTQNEILTDFWKVVSDNGGIVALSGDIYKKTRPADSELEDTVLSIIPGGSGKFIQDGALYVRIFYKDIENGSTYYEDSARGQTAEQLLIYLSETLLLNNDYSFEVSSRATYTEAVPELKQHYAILIMNFKSL